MIPSAPPIDDQQPLLHGNSWRSNSTYVPVPLNDSTPLLGFREEQSPSALVTNVRKPSVYGSLLAGTFIMSSLVGMVFYILYVPQVSVVISYPLTYLAMVHVSSFLLLIPGLFYQICCAKEKRSYNLPLSIISEILFVGYFALLYWLQVNNIIENSNILEVFFSSHLIMVAIVSLPWFMERIDIATAVFVLIASAAGACITTDDTKGWTWDIQNDWPSIAISAGSAVVFALYHLSARKSASTPASGIYHVLLIHSLVASVLSVGLAAGLEMYYFDSWEQFKNIFTSGDSTLAWVFPSVVAVGVAYKFCLMVLLRFSNSHIASMAVQCSILMVICVGPIYSLIANMSNPDYFIEWVKEKPRVAAGIVLLAVTVLYWIISTCLLHYRYNKKYNQLLPKHDNLFMMENYGIPGYNKNGHKSTILL
eukprot:TRINITY_DN11237_c0_g1_i1.p1 TRINITY_DN11237_c0_g1~~TRINITY_DN11237_c0_g1_i1.p1  ORF type:complete len:422 (+),score=76.44 TRINITY_DN11237_c0_g1_i1:39-1304(+)